jgi:hypothetical protein
MVWREVEKWDDPRVWNAGGVLNLFDPVRVFGTEEAYSSLFGGKEDAAKVADLLSLKAELPAEARHGLQTKLQLLGGHVTQLPFDCVQRHGQIPPVDPRYDVKANARGAAILARAMGAGVAAKIIPENSCAESSHSFA